VKRARLVLLMLLVPSALFAEAGRNTAALLTRTLDARSAALGQALTADMGNIDDASFNPAGIAQLENPAVNATYQNGLLDDSVGAINYARDTDRGGWFVGASALDAGMIDLNQSDGTTGSRHAEQDVLGTIGAAFGRHSPVAFGVAAKYLRSQLAETATADAVAGDAGLLWKTPWRGFQLGASYQNLGTDLKYENTKESLPATGRVGASYVLDLEESARTPDILRCRYLFLLDGIKTKNDSSSYNAGLEIRKRIDSDVTPGYAALRGGYIEATKAVALGLGFTLWNISFDYAINIINDVDNTHRFTLGYHFAPKPEKGILK
jgi:hypothetical protein